MKRIFTLVGILLLTSCTKDEMFLEIEEQILKQQLDTTSVVVTPPPPAGVTQTRNTFTLYKESYLNQRSGFAFTWSHNPMNSEYNMIMKNSGTKLTYAGGQAYGDVNNDGYQDILTAVHKSETNFYLSWFINKGDDLNFTEDNSFINQPTIGFSGHKILKTDVNNDGIADYIALGVIEETGNYGGNFTVLIGNSNGRFDVNDIPNPPNPDRNNNRYYFHNGAAGDLNNDGFVDVVTADYIFWGNGRGDFSNSYISFSEMGIKPSLTYEIIDINKDGMNDIIVGTPFVSNSTTTIILNNNGTFNSQNRIIKMPKSSFSGTMDIEVIDIDNDGDLDIVELKDKGFKTSENPNSVEEGMTNIFVYHNNNLNFTLDESLLSVALDGNFLNGTDDKYGWSRFKFDDADGDGQDEILAENYQEGKYNALKKIDGIWKKVTLKFGK